MSKYFVIISIFTFGFLIIYYLRFLYSSAVYEDIKLVKSWKTEFYKNIIEIFLLTVRIQ